MFFFFLGKKDGMEFFCRNSSYDITEESQLFILIIDS
jgi:hypothetical protein